MASRIFRFAIIPHQTLSLTLHSRLQFQKHFFGKHLCVRRQSSFPYPGEDNFLRIARARQPSLKAVCSLNRGIKNEEAVRRDVTVVMIQLSKLTPGGERTIKTVLRKYAKRLGPECALGALWELIRRNDAKRSIEAFEALYNLPWFQPDPLIYSQLIHLTGREGDLAKAIDIFHLMDKHSCPKTTLTYTALIEAYGRKFQTSKVLEIFQNMKQLPGCFPDESTYSSVMRILCKVNRVDEATSLLNEMVSFGVMPNLINFNVLIDGLGRSGKIEKMENMYVRMEKSFLKPDVQTYNSFIHAYGKWGNIDKMEACFEKMQLDNCPPDYITFNYMIESYSKWELYEKMMNTLIHMVRMKYKASVFVFNTVLYALGNANKIDEMEKVMKLFNNSFLKPNTKTFSALVNGYGVAQRREKIMQLMKKVKAWELTMDAYTYNDVLIALSNSNALSDVKKVIKEMKNVNLKPDSAAISALIVAYARSGVIEEMEQIYLAARNENLKFNLNVYNAVISAYGQKKQFISVQNVWEDIFRAGLTPDAGSFSELITAFANCGKFNEMEKNFEIMKQSNLPISQPCLVSLLQVYSESDQITEMDQIWKILQNGQFKWSEPTVQFLVACYSRNGMMEKSENILSRFVNMDGIPNWPTYCSALNGYGFSHVVNEIDGEISLIESSRLPVDLKLISCLFWALSACKSDVESKIVVRWICEFSSGFYKPLMDVLLLEPPGDGIQEILLFQNILSVLDHMRSRMDNPKILRFVYGGLVSTLWNYGLRRRADIMVEDGKLRGIFSLEVSMQDPACWTADFHFLPKAVAKVSFYKWLQTCYENVQKFEKDYKSDRPVLPATVTVVLHGRTVRGRDGAKFLSTSEGGLELENILKYMDSPFYFEEGCLRDMVVAEGNAFFDWLKDVFDLNKLVEKKFVNENCFGPGWASKQRKELNILVQ